MQFIFIFLWIVGLAIKPAHYFLGVICLAVGIAAGYRAATRPLRLR
jgi:hypothetical protein